MCFISTRTRKICTKNRERRLRTCLTFEKKYEKIKKGILKPHKAFNWHWGNREAHHNRKKVIEMQIEMFLLNLSLAECWCQVERLDAMGSMNCCEDLLWMEVRNFIAKFSHPWLNFNLPHLTFHLQPLSTRCFASLKWSPLFKATSRGISISSESSSSLFPHLALITRKNGLKLWRKYLFVLFSFFSRCLNLNQQRFFTRKESVKINLI